MFRSSVYHQDAGSAIREEAIVVTEDHLITSIGPSTCYAFAYALVDALKGDSLAVKNRMVYFNAFDESTSHRDACPETVQAPEKAVIPQDLRFSRV